MSKRQYGSNGQIIDERVNQLIGWYGDGIDGASPTRDQWRHVVQRSADSPVTLVNFFKLRADAAYTEVVAGVDSPGTGQDAFNRYAQVSMPTLEKVGGKFLMVAPFEAMFVGNNEDWDLVAIGSYPNNDALLALFEDAEYRAAFVHRTAACERQKVYICSG